MIGPRCGRVVPAWLLVALATAACQHAPEPSPPHVVLISIDGFRHDFRDITDTPALDALAAGGVRATALQPVFPTMTFPNHYSIATGLYPHEHGIVDNTFPDATRTRWYTLRDRDAVGDGSWYGGEPIWVTAARAGLRTAAFYFVGTEAAIGGVRPDDWYAFDPAVPGEARVQQVLDWLGRPATQRPRLITLYFEDVDKATHDYGPESPASLAAIRRVDGYLQRLLDGAARLGLNDQLYVVVVSDHGQARTRRDAPPFVLADHVSLDGVHVVDHGSLAMLFLDDPRPGRAAALRDAINAAWRHGRAYMRTDTPAGWRVTDDPRFGDVIVVADVGHVVSSQHGRGVSAGDHGWAPDAPQMQGTFIARGPRLPVGKVIDEASVVDVYALLLGILELPAPPDHPRPDGPLRQLLAPNYVP